MTLKIKFLLLLALLPVLTYSQSEIENNIRKIYDLALTDHAAYSRLHYLSKNIGPRLIGSPQAAQAVAYLSELMVESGFDTIFLQQTYVRSWKRGPVEKAAIRSGLLGKQSVHVCALGGSVSTPSKGINAQVIEVDSLAQLKTLGFEKIRGKIVFFNRPMDPKYIRPGRAYGMAADQRVHGASEAARFGAVGVIVRSLTLSSDAFPHTGIMHYDTTVAKIPAVAIATLDADLLSSWLKRDTGTTCHFTLSATEGEPVLSHNVLGELQGLPGSSIIVVGGHIDSWDLGEGAQDDGVACLQSIEALTILKKMGYHPKHTLRCVLFMDEEIGQSGGRTYASWSKSTKQNHLAAIELDAGASTPTGFSMSGDSLLYETFKEYQSFLLPYGLYSFQKGGGGVDISFLSDLGVPLIGMNNFSQRYFDYHHSALDVFETVNEREMQLGSAALAALIFLLDQQ